MVSKSASKTRILCAVNAVDERPDYAKSGGAASAAAIGSGCGLVFKFFSFFFKSLLTPGAVI